MSKHTSPVRLAKTESKKIGSIKSQFSTKPDFDINVPVTGVRPVLPWPEWNDIDVTNENWDCKTTEDKIKQSTRSNATSNTQLVFFKDDQLKLPVSWIIYDWKRPSDLFTDPGECVLFVDRNEISVHDLIAENQHIIHSEFIRTVLSSILTVWHLGSNGSFPIEGETTTFVSNTKHLSWRPWHHVYSMCKAGKNSQHNPQINPIGKYIVRLYFMGSWRKIVVDDQIPVSIEGNILLPFTTERNELWLLLLTKAFMKLASVTWTSDREIVEFNPILCLTGWIVQERNVNGMSVDDVWIMCNNFVNQFSVTREKRDANIGMSVKELESNVDPTESKRHGKSKEVIGKKNSKGVSRSRVDKDSSKSVKESQVSTQRKSSLKQSQVSGGKEDRSSVTSSKAKSRSFNGSRKGSSKGRTYSDTSRTKTSTKKITEDTNVNKDPVLFAHLSDNWPITDRQTPTGVAISLSHSFLVLQTRDTPFVCQKPRPGVPGWKRYRWINWATKRGIFNPDMLLPFRSLQIVSVFSDWIDKIEEKDNQIATTGTELTEGAHASGDPGGTDKLAKKLQRRVEPIIDKLNSKTAESTPKANLILVSEGQDGKLKKATKQQGSDSKKSIVTTASGKSKKVKDIKLKKATNQQGSNSMKSIATIASGKLKHDYLDTVFSHRSMQYINPEETGITKCGTSIWTDFNHIWNSLDKMLVYYKPSAFRYKINISNFILNRETRVVRRKSISEKKSLIEAVQYVIVPYTVQQSRNDGVYMAFDAVECIKVIFMLSSIPGHTLYQSKISCTGEKREEDYVDNADTLIPPKKAAPVNVIVEVFNWSSYRFNETVLVLESVGTKSSTLTLGPGRHVLRVWVKTDTAFILQCLSESTMIAGNIFKVVNTMCNYSERMASFLQQMRNKLSYMILTFGKTHFVNALHAVFQNINTISTKQNNDLVHQVFMDSILETVKHYIATENTLHEYIITLRVLFLNVSLGLEKKRKVSKGVFLKNAVGSNSEAESEVRQVIDYDKYNEGDSDTSRIVWLTEPGYENRYEDAAYLIQASWKRYLVLKLMKIHRNTQTKEHKLIVEKMRKLHEALFASVTYGDVIFKILRTMFELEPKVAQWLPLHNDFGRIVKTEEFQGLLVNISPNMWLPVARMIVHCHSDTPMTAVVNVICQFSTYMVRVIDNDNLLEQPRTVFNVDPCMYSKNENGYTIFVYAWSESIQKETPWKLQIVTLKESPSLHPCTFPTKAETCTVNKPPALVNFEISNYYIPNRENIICRLLILVKSKMLVSIRLSSSFKGVKFTACLQDKDRFPLVHARAEEGAVIIPAVLLDIDNNSVETLYILEAKVINNSWPLTRKEWIVQERLQNEYVTHRERTVVFKATSRLNISNGTFKKMDLPKVQMGSRKKKDSTNEFPMEEPFWMVQTVVDYPQRDFIKVKQDRRREEAVSAMKKAWESADPGRAKRGQDLRSEFIRETYGTEHDKTSSVRQIHIREKVFDSKNVSTVKVNVLDDETTERFHDPPVEFAIAQSMAHFRKAIGEYCRVGNEKEAVVKTRELHEKELLDRRIQQEEFLEAHNNDVDERGRMLNEQRRKHAMIYASYDAARLQSERLLNSAYRVRDEYVWNKMEEEEVRKRIEALKEKLGKKLSSKKSSRKSSAKKKLSSKKSSRKSSAKKKGKK